MSVDFTARRVVVFDMDDTLFPEHDFVRSGFLAVAKQLRRTGGTEGFFEVAWRRFESGERGNIFDATLAELGVASAPGLVKELVGVYRGHHPDIRPDSWVAPLFARLRAEGRKIGVITDGPPVMQRAKVDALGLPGIADAIVLSDELGGESSRKPCALPYETLASMLGAKPDECVYVGDNPAKDFVGARRAGWGSVRLRIPGRLHSDAGAEGEFRADVDVGSGAALDAILSRAAVRGTVDAE